MWPKMTCRQVEPLRRSELRKYKITFLVVLMLLLGAFYAKAQYIADTEYEQVLFSVVNNMRAKAGLPVLSIDPRLKAAARTHLAEFATHDGQYSDRYPAEPSLIDRVAAAKVSCTSAGEVVLKLPDTMTDDAQRTEQALQTKESLAVVLNPRYSSVGFAIAHSDSYIYAVGNFADSFRAMPVDETEKLVDNELQQTLVQKNLPPFSAAGITYLRADLDIVQRRLAPIPATLHDRIEKLRHQFLAAKVYGPVEVKSQSVPGQAEPNLIGTIRGSEASTIIIAVDTDHKVREGQEQVNWGTDELLPLLAESIAGFPSRHTLQFVAFSSAKGKHSGVESFFEQFDKEQRKKIAAVIELEQIGIMAPSFAPGNQGSQLGRRLRLAARALQLQDPEPFYTDAYSPIGAHMTTLMGEGPITHTFDGAKIPAITIYSRDDVLPNKFSDIDREAYYNTYLLLCVYIRQLDQDLKR